MRDLLVAKWMRSLVLMSAFALLTAAYAFLPLTAPSIPASPDESANLFFAELFADRGELWRVEELDIVAPGMVHPRSTRTVDGFLVPGGFLGLPVLYGGAAALFGKAVIPYLTPIVAALAVFAWGALVAWLFGRRIGLFAGLLLAFNPIWWYETARTLQPNVLFVSLVIVALWLFLTEPTRRRLGDRVERSLLKHADPALAGIAAGLALATRPSEAYWLAGGALIAAWFGRRAFPWRRLLIAAVFAIAATAPFVLFSASAYGSPFATGYGEAGAVPVAELPQGQGAVLLSAVLGPLQPYLFPFGFAPRSALRHFADFGIGIVAWWAWLVGCALVALALEARHRRRTGERLSASIQAFGLIALTVSLWLVFFYGSWTVRDNPDPDAVTIGSSYLRYWLPIYVFSTVPVAWLVSRATSVLPSRFGKAFAVLFIACAALSGATDVFLSPQEGLLATRASLYDSVAKAEAIFAETAEDGVIVVDRADKYLFPRRKVIVPLRSDATYKALSELKRFAPLYYFGITFPESDLAWLRETKLPPLGLDIEPIRTIGEETLYRFVPTSVEAPQP